jgi:Zn-dependent M28 family amino/carboxypeptidase
VPLVGSPATPGAATVEGELVWLELPEGARRLRPGSLRGKILALFGSLPTDAALHQQLLRAEPAVVIQIDERLPFAWAKNDGMYPYWVRRYGVRPTLTVPYLDAWRWRQTGVTCLRAKIVARPVPGESQNVVGEIPGRDPSLPAIVVTAHHDTQCHNVGADDNASGVVALLALARHLAATRARPLRTIRLISFGTEEQLSVGADAYVRRHPTTRRDTALVLNFDSVASPLGHFVLWVAGAAALETYATRRLAAHGVDVVVRRQIVPFFDHFPFNRVGVPTLTLMRENFSGGRWQHHSAHDSLENISASELQRLLDATTPLLTGLAAKRTLPFPPGLPREQQAVARQLGRDLLGGANPST